MKRLNIGILGCGKVCDFAILAPWRDGAPIDIVACASRELRKAEAFAARHGIRRAYGSYAALLQDPQVQAVYVALPNGLHCEWTLAALQAGRHVLCEKPLANNADEARAMLHAAQAAGLTLMEASHWQCHPLARRVRALLAEQAIGRLQHLEAVFRLRRGLIPESDVRFDFQLGGGAMMDLGFYPLSLAREVAGEDPVEIGPVQASVVHGQVDTEMDVRLRYRSGLTARLRCSMVADDLGERTVEQHATLEGSAGRLHVEQPFTPAYGGRLVLQRHGEAPVTEDADPRSSWYFQAGEFAARVAAGHSEPDAAALANMALMDRLYEAAGLSRRPTGVSQA